MLASTLKKWMLPVVLCATLAVTAPFSALLLAAPAFTGCGGATVEPTNPQFEQRVVELVNAARLAEGLPPYKHSPELANAARYHAADMQQDDYFQHDTFDVGGDEHIFGCHWYERLQTYYPITQAGENIAAGHRTPEELVNGWLNSPGHRRNILSTSWEIGVGFFDFYWVQDVSRRDNVYPLVINREAATTDTVDVTLYLYGSWDELRLRNDGSEWSGWQPFSNEVTWQLAAIPGLRLVEAEMRTSATSALSSDTVELSIADLPPPTATPVNTPAPPQDPAGGVLIEGQVQFEGRPNPPSAQWVAPLDLQLIPHNEGGNDERLRAFTSTTSDMGKFTLEGIEPGAYDLVVKGEHTLQRVLPMIVETGPAIVDVGLLAEGDAVEDNLINVLDFSLMTSVFGACLGDDAFVTSADFDMDGCVDQQDFGLLRNNFGRAGDAPEALAVVGAATTSTGLTVTSKRHGEGFTVQISIRDVVTGVPDAGALYINFNPQLLKAVSIAPNAAFSVILQNAIDNKKGRIDIAAGLLGDHLEAPFIFSEITFEARQDFPQTEITLETTDMRRTELAQHGVSLLADIPGGSDSAVQFVEIMQNSTVFLPIVNR
jgi:uncharacterized protein YkwD